MSSSIKRNLLFFSFVLSIILGSLIICSLIFCWGRERVLLCSSGFPGTQYVANPGLNFMTVLLPQPPEC